MRNCSSEFGADTLVINGVDAQTNSHETGRLFNWTGSNTEGTALFVRLVRRITVTQPTAGVFCLRWDSQGRRG